MNLFSNLQQQYDQLWKYVIRPTRTTYPQKNLGPQTFELQGRKVKRIDFQVINPRGHVLFCSHFIPLQQQQYPCVIYMHGNSSNRTEGIQYLGHLMRLNISLCTFDFSGCGNSQGDYVSLGFYEQDDLQQIVKYISKRPHITNIAIWGRSMGAVTALLYLRRSKYICAAICDSPFKSLKALVQDLCKKNSKIPSLIIQGALKIIAGTIEQKANFSIYKINPLKNQVPHLMTPIFFMVGTQDDLIPPEHTIQLFQKYKGQTKYLQKVKGNHNDTRPEDCIDKILAFLLENLFIEKQNTQSAPSTKNIIKKQFDFFNDEDQTIENSSNSKQSQQNVDFFSDQFQDQVKKYQKQNGQIDFFALNSKSNDKKVAKPQQSYSLTSILSNVFTSAITPIKQTKKRSIDGYEKTIEQIGKAFQIEQTSCLLKTKRQINNFYDKQRSETNDQKDSQFQRDIISNLQTWAF